MPVISIFQHPDSINHIMDYAAADNIKDGVLSKRKLEVNSRGINCPDILEFALKRMQQTKCIWRKSGCKAGRQYIHMAISFAPGELSKDKKSDHEVALEYGEKFAQTYFGKSYEVFVTVHANSKGVETEKNGGCLHVHLVVNTVDINNGNKLIITPSDLKILRKINDDLSVDYGFAVIDNSKTSNRPFWRKNEYKVNHSEDKKCTPFKLNAYNLLVDLSNISYSSLDELGNRIKSAGWTLLVKEPDLILEHREARYSNGYPVKFKFDALAKQFKNENISSFNFARKSNCYNIDSFIKDKRSFKRQAAELLHHLIKSNPGSVSALNSWSQKFDWKIECAKSTVYIKHQRFKNKSNTPKRYSCNRLAADFNLPLISSYSIMRLCNESEFRKFECKNKKRQLEYETACLEYLDCLQEITLERIMQQENIKLNNASSKASDNDKKSKIMHSK